MRGHTRVISATRPSEGKITCGIIGEVGKEVGREREGEFIHD
jgi:hypothetical protein